MPVLHLYRNQSIDLHSKPIDWFLYKGNTGIKWVYASAPKKKEKDLWLRILKVRLKFHVSSKLQLKLLEFCCFRHLKKETQFWNHF